VDKLCPTDNIGIRLQFGRDPLAFH